MKVLIADKIDYTVLNRYKDKSIKFDYFPEITPDELLEKIASYDGLIVRSRTKVTKNLIVKGKKLKVIGRAGSGLDNIDVDASKQYNIKVVNTPGANSNAVAELTVALILSLLRNIEKANSSMRAGLWIKKELKGQELSGQVIGIVGYGNIGKKLRKLLSSFGVKILYYSKSEKNSSLKKLFSTSDIISVHLSYSPETKNLIGKDLLSLMKQTSYFINTSRGQVVDEKILYEALKSKSIAGAALDVFWDEPLASNSRWRTLDNVILTPHIGASTSEALTVATEEIINKIVSNLK